MTANNPAYEPMYEAAPIPPDYRHRFSVLRAVLPTIRFGAIGLLSLVLLGYGVYELTVTEWKDLAWILIGAAFLSILFCTWRIYGSWWAWKHFGIVIHAKTGMMEIVQKGPWILGLPYSSDDTVNLARSDLVTPDRTLLQRKYFFDCDTITYNSMRYDPRKGKYVQVVRELEHVRHAEHIKRIQQYVRSLTYMEADFARQARDLQQRNNEELQGLRADLREYSGRPPRPSRPESQPTPDLGLPRSDDIVEGDILED